jgi:hypothetical protein
VVAYLLPLFVLIGWLLECSADTAYQRTSPTEYNRGPMGELHKIIRHCRCITVKPQTTQLPCV